MSDDLLLPSAKARLASGGTTVPIVGKTIVWCDACREEPLFAACCRYCRFAFYMRTSNASLISPR